MEINPLDRSHLILSSYLDLDSIIAKVRDVGYHFVDNALTEEAQTSLIEETTRLTFEDGNHVDYPINPGTKNEVRQLHERAYFLLGHTAVPITSQFCHTLSKTIALRHPELAGWLPNEIGYQRYRGSRDWISPHRDRRSDRLFSVTFTITGSATVNIYTSLVDPPGYKHLILVTSWITKPGTAMFLRAPGLGSGEQTIHEVCPPANGERLILNLRMRPSILKRPGETR